MSEQDDFIEWYAVQSVQDLSELRADFVMSDGKIFDQYVEWLKTEVYPKRND